MLRLLIRLVGLLTLGAAFAALVVDGTRSVAAGAFLPPLALGQTASDLFPGGLDKLHLLMAAHAPKLWDPVTVTILRLPTWLVLGVVGILLFAITRRPAPKIGYSRR